MEQRMIQEIIRKFLEGTCNDEEFAYLLAWYESFDETDAIQLSEEEKSELEKALFHKIASRIPDWPSQLQKNEEELEKEHQHIRYRKWLKYAAAALVIGFMAGVAWWTVQQVHQVMQVNSQSIVSSNEIALNNMTQRMYLIILSDSTKVWLSPNSRLQYPDKFTGKERIVHLKGEAFFEVTKNPQHPFVIYSDQLITRVWGTSFLVKAIEGKPAEVSVLTGKVSVQKNGAEDGEVMLYPHQKAVLDPSGRLIKETEQDEASIQRWQKVNLSFDNTPLANVITSLEKHYDVQIRCSDAALLNYTLTGDFNEQHLSDVLELIEKSLNVHYRIISDSVIEMYTIPNGSP
ncbi:FecR family protein [Thermoflavifilum thermophilum]|uniref:FecR family protein n=1 Tax=Thermoflavifilum thermophilum TaxID=1393122 RepID=UPI001C9E9AE5|nr:FecR domain-containing protein [Thermoflavifilum thermophilum]